jgi:hypothetical protein
MIGIGVSGVIFAAVKHFARGSPRTMTPEWQKATDEYLKVRYSSNMKTRTTSPRLQSAGLGWCSSCQKSGEPAP